MYIVYVLYIFGGSNSVVECSLCMRKVQNSILCYSTSDHFEFHLHDDWVATFGHGIEGALFWRCCSHGFACAPVSRPVRKFPSRWYSSHGAQAPGCRQGARWQQRESFCRRFLVDGFEEERTSNTSEGLSICRGQKKDGERSWLSWPIRVLNKCFKESRKKRLGLGKWILPWVSWRK